MNWLAHVLLSESSPRFRAGNILPDVLGMQSLAPLGAEYQRGIACHHVIDAFTDEHPIFARSRRRFHAGYRRFSGILVDVFYDHVLAAQWREHAGIPLAEFVAGFYADLAVVRGELPESIHPLLDQPFVPKWLLEYVHYHEKLHSVVPEETDSAGRRRVHTEEFNRREKTFPRYRRARQWEAENLARFLR